MTDRDYIALKIKHMKTVLGMNADMNPNTGAARPDWAKSEADEREKRYTAITKARNTK